MTNFSVQDASGSTKEFKAVSGDGSGGSPFVSEVGLADVGETVDVGRVNLIGTAQANGAVRATGATIPAYAVAMGASDGTNLQIPVCDASKFLKVVLQAGTAAFGKLAANSGVDIGDVDVTSLPQGATVYNGQTYVTTAGTQVALASSQAITHSGTIMAPTRRSAAPTATSWTQATQLSCRSQTWQRYMLILPSTAKVSTTSPRRMLRGTPQLGHRHASQHTGDFRVPCCHRCGRLGRHLLHVQVDDVNSHGEVGIHVEHDGGTD